MYKRVKIGNYFAYLEIVDGNAVFTIEGMGDERLISVLLDNSPRIVPWD